MKMTQINFTVTEERLEDFKDLLRTCVDTSLPFVNTETAELFLKIVEEGEE